MILTKDCYMAVVLYISSNNGRGFFYCPFRKGEICYLTRGNQSRMAIISNIVFVLTYNVHGTLDTKPVIP